MQHADNPDSTPFIYTMSTNEKLEQYQMWETELQPSEELTSTAVTSRTAAKFIQQLNDCWACLQKVVKAMAPPKAFKRHFQKQRRENSTLEM